MKRTKLSWIAVFLALLMLSSAWIPVFAEESSGGEGDSISALEEAPAYDLQILAKNLSLENSICIYYAVPVEGTNDADVKMLFWTAPQTEYVYGTQTYELAPEPNTMNVTVKGSPVECYVFNFDKLAAKQMTLDIYSKVYVNDGDVEYYSDLDKYSVLQYCYNMLGKTSSNEPTAELEKLLNSVLAYGAAAQEFFGVNLDRLADATYYQVKIVGATLPDGSTQGLYKTGDTISVTAPEINALGESFLNWQNTAWEKISENQSCTITVEESNEIYRAAYDHEGAHPTIKAGTSAVRVMSFNVQVELPTEKVNNLYVPNAAATNRIEAVRQEILYYSPDLVGLQEDSKNWLTYLNLEDYNRIAPISYLSDSSERCAIYYKKGMTLLDSGSAWLTHNGQSDAVALTYKEVTDPKSKFYLNETDCERLMISSDADLKAGRKRYWDEETGEFVDGTTTYNCTTTRKFTYGVFEVNGQQLIYINTHLTHRSQNADYSNEHLQKIRSNARLKEWDILMTHLQQIKQEYPDALVFFTGDFNDNVGKPIYNYVTQTFGYNSAEAVTLEHVGIHGSWNNSFVKDVMGDNYPNEKKPSADYLDYCFVEDGLTVERFTVGAGKAQITAVDGSEKIIYTSDHLPVITDISFKTATTGSPIVPDDDFEEDLSKPSVYTGIPDIFWYTGDKDEYILTTADQFAGFFLIRQNGGGNITFEGVTIKLARDLIINRGTVEEFVSGDHYELTALNSGYQFKGTFDGQGHTVSGIYMQCTNTAVKGLFGGIGDNAVIKNLTLDQCYVGGPSEEKNTLGLLAARVSGTNVLFENITITNFLMKEGDAVISRVGALVGCVNSSKSLAIKNCQVSGTIDCKNYGKQIGSLVGRIESKATLDIKESTANVNISGVDYCGGLIGYNSSGTYSIDDLSSYNGTITCPGANKGNVISNP